MAQRNDCWQVSELLFRVDRNTPYFAVLHAFYLAWEAHAAHPTTSSVGYMFSSTFQGLVDAPLEKVTIDDEVATRVALKMQTSRSEVAALLKSFQLKDDMPEVRRDWYLSRLFSQPNFEERYFAAVEDVFDEFGSSLDGDEITYFRGEQDHFMRDLKGENLPPSQAETELFEETTQWDPDGSRQTDVDDPLYE